MTRGYSLVEMGSNYISFLRLSSSQLAIDAQIVSSSHSLPRFLGRIAFGDVAQDDDDAINCTDSRFRSPYRAFQRLPETLVA